MRNHLLAAAFALVSAAAFAHEGNAECHHPEQPEAKEAKGGAKGGKAAEKKSEAATDGWVLTRGAKLGASPAVDLKALLASPAEQDGKTVTLEGTVRKACARKGCWMELAADEKSPGVRVTFKDYGFFVPVDSAGSKARVEGTVKVAELSEDTAKHYASEGAIVPRGADGKPREVQLVALGVELRK